MSLTEQSLVGLAIFLVAIGYLLIGYQIGRRFEVQVSFARRCPVTMPPMGMGERPRCRLRSGHIGDHRWWARGRTASWSQTEPEPWTIDT